MVAFTAARKQRLPTSPRLWLHLAMLAIITNIAPYFLFAVAELRISSGFAGVLNATTPLFTLLLALGTKTERTTRTRVLGLLTGLAGVSILLAPWSTQSPGGLAGIAAGLLASACYAVGYVYAKRFLTSNLPALVLATGQMVAGTLLVALLLPVIIHQPATLTPAVIAAVVVLGVAGTGFAYVLNYQLIADEGPVSASTVTYLIPVVAVSLGASILGEPVTWSLLIGAATILAGVALSQRVVTPEGGLQFISPTQTRRSDVSQDPPRPPDSTPPLDRR
jgi:drug/metabolite transporter (DMT)-like permease